MRLTLAGGGTGGHLFPGLALAEEVRRRYPEAAILLMCTERDEAYEATRQAGIERVTIPCIHTGSLLRRLLALVPAFWRAWRCLGRFRPDVLVGLGGYGSIAPVLCARLRGIPAILLEQNVIPGRANRLLSRFANEVAAQWEESAPHFRCRDRVRITGNPVRGVVARRDRAVCAQALGLDPAAPTLLVMGGSQGARPLNKIISEALPLIARSGARVQFIHLAGSLDAEGLRATYEQYAMSAQVFAFLADMSLAYSACDLALSRAGGTSLAELTALGIPAILVPYPYATDNHQHHNAAAVERRGAAVVLEQASLSPHRLAHYITGLLGDPERLAEMGTQSRRAGLPQAAAVVADRLEALARRRRRGQRPWPLNLLMRSKEPSDA